MVAQGRYDYSRLKRGINIGGGFDTGRSLQDSCNVVDANQQKTFSLPLDASTALGYCHVVTPFKAQTQYKLHGIIPIKYGFVAALAWQNLSGPAVNALYSISGVIPGLGRTLSAGSKIVPIIAPQTVFEDRISGGVVPRNFIPSVEKGVVDFLKAGPLGFPVVDVAVTLKDGSYHAVDSSDMAFRQAGRIAMVDGMPKCNPVLLEPVMQVEIAVPNDATAKITGIVSQRRGQIQGFEPREGDAIVVTGRIKHYAPQGKTQLYATKIEQGVLGVGLLHNARNNVAFAVCILFKLAIAFYFTNALAHDLAECLSGNSTEVGLVWRVIALVDPVAIVINVVCSERDVHVFRVDSHDDFFGCARTLFVRRSKRLYQHLQ